MWICSCFPGTTEFYFFHLSRKEFVKEFSIEISFPEVILTIFTYEQIFRYSITMNELIRGSIVNKIKILPRIVDMVIRRVFQLKNLIHFLFV